ncbi:pyruvate/2-oxoglutarate dehydrogenase complex, dihydrolipoamide acyltransferase component [Frankia torreyi]|uniref:Dihydrolipoamide acetyltransferase component of pyruvate dehydrogenase complex n=1 Tax=Frankia torreyi TaxID=1856 RepID=A0A0D8BFK3_9ACTN|nr:MULTISPECIES: dihydrolipoamide acetyltransferase family protein [Frankia]KJE22830.1 pyruvate/2-oxoglutarate dehydrogenase complex, dihydrolipoamide acyltransferase component [Frankia torreyi]
MAQRQFRLPDLGEGLTDADIVRWLVQVGDSVTVNQPLVEVETAKAVVEIPSPFAGVLVEIHGEAGSTLAVGEPLLTVRTADAGQPEPADAAPAPATAAFGSAGGAAGGGRLPASRDGGAGERVPVLVGYGPRQGQQRRRSPRRQAAPGPARGSGPARVDGAGLDKPAVLAKSAVLAKPPVRKLARDLGVDLAGIAGTGPDGTISRDDVQAAVHTVARAAPAATPASQPTAPEATATPTAPEATPPANRRIGAVPADAAFSSATGAWHVPVVGVRRSMAQAMVASVTAAPHVTEFLSVDVTATMAARERVAALPEFGGIKVTPLLFVAKALLVAVRRHPMINSRWVEDGGAGRAEIQVPDRVNLGIAVAGPRGLVVPNIPDAGRLDLVGLARALAGLTASARADRLDPTDLRSGTITITNVGVLGVDVGTPILNPPEAAILALGSIRPTPWVHDGQLTVRTVVQLALSFDHRIVDGELGAAVLADVGAVLTDPTLALAWS